jgi:L-lactate utilization protein LutB
MTDLLLDLGLLQQLADDLAVISREFTNADKFSKDVADATGHDALRQQVEDFADKWNDKREKMVEELDALQSMVKAVSDGFTTVDDRFAKALEEGAAETLKSNPGAAPK